MGLLSRVWWLGVAVGGTGVAVLVGGGVNVAVGGTGVGVGVGPPAPKPQAKDVASSKDTIKTRNTLRFVVV
jgi:hypothetical protein